MKSNLSYRLYTPSPLNLRISKSSTDLVYQTNEQHLYWSGEKKYCIEKRKKPTLFDRLLSHKLMNFNISVPHQAFYEMFFSTKCLNTRCFPYIPRATSILLLLHFSLKIFLAKYFFQNTAKSWVLVIIKKSEM